MLPSQAAHSLALGSLQPLFEPPAPGPPRFSVRATQRQILRNSHTPVEALRALRPLGAALLESRSDHPEARHAFIPFNPVMELRLNRDHIEEHWAGGATTRIGAAPFARLCEWLDGIRYQGPPDIPFSGGWVGYLSHEASQWILDMPTPQAAPPARPDLPMGFFRLYRDVLVYDRHANTRTLLLNDLGEGPQEVRRRQRQAEEVLSRDPAPPASAARAQANPHATLTRDEFEDRILHLQSLVRNGDCFQANLTSSFAFPWTEAPSPENLITLYDEYASANPGAWGGFFETPDCTLLSSSPELLAALSPDRLRLRPIAGTRPRGATAAEDARLAEELRTDPKERAEHAMLVDLARNDAAALCRPGTVEVPNFAGVERYRHVMHLVSEVEGVPRPHLTIRELLSSVFPGGTVTGCPKRRAVRRIAETEGGPRGPYTGTLGFVGFNGHSEWNLLIRTLVATPTHVVAHAGCGIVEGSRPPLEAAELEAKARAQVEAALGLASPAPPHVRCGHVEPGNPWRPQPPIASGTARVLLVDFEDSFVHNLADYFSRLGATTTVWSAHQPVVAAWQEPPTHLVFSPGPGRPEDFPAFAQHLARADAAQIPVLGVCLGHQGLAQFAGARIVRHGETVHGRSSRVTKTATGTDDIIVGPWQGERAARYHSLVATDLPPRLESLAELEDGTCMALRYRDRPWWGLQFHPESLLTEDGLRLAAAFLGAGRL